MPAYRILSLDGGGIRGLFTARVLSRLNAAVPGFLQQIDLIAGTSSGGIIALGLAAGLDPEELVTLYRDEAATIFDDSWLDNLKDLGRLRGAQYNNKNLKALLTDVLVRQNRHRLQDLPQRVLVSSFDLDDKDDARRNQNKPRTWKPKFFHNYPGLDSDGQELIVDVALRTSAAPTYFPSYDGYIDGAVVANNPAMAALAQALHAPTGNQQLPDICLLSIGSGTNPTYIAGKVHDWGYAQWAKPLIDLMVDGVMGVADYQCRQLLDDRYHRFSHILDRVINLDDYRKTSDLLRYADQADISSTVTWVQQHF